MLVSPRCGELKTLTIFPHVQVNLVFGHAVSAELLDTMESIDGVEAPHEEEQVFSRSMGETFVAVVISRLSKRRKSRSA